MKRPFFATRPLVGLLLTLVLVLAGCSLHRTDETIPRVTIATVLPETGPEAAAGLAMERAVDLAVQQHTTSISGYRLTVQHIDSAKVSPDAAFAAAKADAHVLGVVGPFEGQAALSMLPAITQSGLTTISPSAALPQLSPTSAATTTTSATASTSATSPNASTNAFFDMAVSTTTLGTTAADLAVAPTRAHGLGASSVYVVDDGTATSKALLTSFTSELKAKGGTVAGASTLNVTDPLSAQTLVSSIIAATPDLVFFSGSATAAATLRRTLTLTGAPSQALLTAGAFPVTAEWTKLVGSPLVAGNTTSLASSVALTSAASAKSFASAYRAAYSQDVTPQSGLAYDAAMDEIHAMQATVAAKKPLTRADVRTAVATTTYSGVTGPVAFTSDGMLARSIPLTLYTCNSAGNWQAQTTIP